MKLYHVGFIGFGRRAEYLWEGVLKPLGSCCLTAIADPAVEAIQKKHPELDECHYYTTAEEMLEKEPLDGVVIGTGCYLHTKYACLAAKYDLPIFLEKPISIDREQLSELEALLPQHNHKTVVSFPLRVTEIVTKVKELLDSGCIGEIAQVQSVNNVYYGRCYYHGWYRNDALTGGLFVTKATHDLDYLAMLVGKGSPKWVCAMESKMVFKGDKPAGLLCKDCPEAATCPESIQNIPADDPQTYGSYCCFATDTGNHDSATAIFQYENGLHVVYTQNFISRKSAGKRGARFIGFKGTLEFDFNTNTIVLTDHFSDEIKTFKLSKRKGHGGGDFLLGQNFVDVMAKRAPSVSTLENAIMGTKLCFAARESAETHRFIEL